jgi:hypothetical protein
MMSAGQAVQQPDDPPRQAFNFRRVLLSPPR